MGACAPKEPRRELGGRRRERETEGFLFLFYLTMSSSLSQTGEENPSYITNGPVVVVLIVAVVTPAEST